MPTQPCNDSLRLSPVYVITAELVLPLRSGGYLELEINMFSNLFTNKTRMVVWNNWCMYMCKMSLGHGSVATPSQGRLGVYI